VDENFNKKKRYSTADYLGFIKNSPQYRN